MDAHSVMKLNIPISKSCYHSPSASLRILYYCHCYCNSDFAPIFPTLAQTQVALSHPAPTTPNYNSLHLGLHLYTLYCFYSYQTMLFPASFEQFESSFQNK